MNINQTKHTELLQAELDYQTFEFEKLLAKQAAKMFVDRQLYICDYQGYDDVRGNIILRFDYAVCQPPRKNEILHCFISNFQDKNVKHWGGITYGGLRTDTSSQFEAKTVFFNYEKDHAIVGVSGIKEQDVEAFKRNALVFLGPTDPPIKYLMNLVDFVKTTSPVTNPYLNISIENTSWHPIPLTTNNPLLEIQNALKEKDTVIVQGPPGTGKTYLMSQICNALINANCNVMVTALTNRALIELAEKDFLKEQLKKGKVFKTSLTSEEQKNKKIKGIQPLKKLNVQNPPLLLSTYYVMSQLANKTVNENFFDYVIVEEASQAFLATIAMAKKLGKKCIVIGDICQLEPIIQKEYLVDSPCNFYWMVNGLKALSYNFNNSKNYILTDSYRLTKNAVHSTNTFYNNLLNSKSEAVLPISFRVDSVAHKFFNTNGGTSLHKIQMDNGVQPSIECVNLIKELITDLSDIDKNVEIAILAFNRETVRVLQSKILQKFNNNDTVYIETVDRIQGMTVDYCIFVIPQGSIPFSIQQNRFNVATSRARMSTLIIADQQINHFIELDSKMKQYFNRI